MFSAAKKLNAAKPQPKSRGEDDVCQRMKNANGFFDGKCYISWNLSSVGEKDVQYPRQKFVVRNARSFDIALQRGQDARTQDSLSPGSRPWLLRLETSRAPLCASAPLRLCVDSEKRRGNPPFCIFNS